MRPDDHSKVMEAGFFSLSGWRCDSARRLPLRQTAPSIGRDLFPQYAREGCKSEEFFGTRKLAPSRLLTCSLIS
jgi:hypothetical protein